MCSSPHPSLFLLLTTKKRFIYNDFILSWKGGEGEEKGRKRAAVRIDIARLRHGFTILEAPNVVTGKWRNCNGIARNVVAEPQISRNCNDIAIDVAMTLRRPLCQAWNLF